MSEHQLDGINRLEDNADGVESPAESQPSPGLERGY